MIFGIISTFVGNYLAKKMVNSVKRIYSKMGEKDKVYRKTRDGLNPASLGG